MYESFYKLSADPFRLSPDPGFSYQHRTSRKAMTYMRHALHRAEGYVMITGQPGTGKTTLVNDLISTIRPSQAVIAKIVSTKLSADELLNLVAYSFKLNVDGCGKAKVLVKIEGFLKQQLQQRRRSLLIVDEAQDLSDDALEELRLLTNLLAGKHQLLQVFLVGQEQLRDTVYKPGLEQLNQRLIAATRLEPLDCDDTSAYIKHRLRCARWAGDPLISKEAYAMIQRYSHGIPRRINQICSRLFLHGCIEEKHRLGMADVRVVVEELQQELLLPLGVDTINGAVPWTAEQVEETYEAETRPRSPVPRAVRPATRPLPATNPIEQSTSPEVVAAPLQRPTRVPLADADTRPRTGNNQARIYQHKHGWQQRFLAKLDALDGHAAKVESWVRDRAGKASITRLWGRTVPLLKAFHQKRRWQQSLLALRDTLGSHAVKAENWLRDRVSMARVRGVWSRVVPVMVLTTIMLGAYIHIRDSDQPADDLETLAQGLAGAEAITRPVTEDSEPESVQPQPNISAIEVQTGSDTRNNAGEANNTNRRDEEIIAAPATDFYRPAALDLAALETAQPASPDAVVVADGTPLPEIVSEVNTKQNEPDQVEAVPVQETVPVVAPLQVSQATRAADSVPTSPMNAAPPPLSAEEKVAELLAYGWRSLEQDRLTVPKKNNAYHYFQRVLKLDPGNSDARSGIDQIVARYTRLATDALDEKDNKKARQYIERGFTINPDNEDLAALQDRMNTPLVAVVVEQPPPKNKPAPVVDRPKDKGFLLRAKAFFSRQSHGNHANDLTMAEVLGQ
jgi:type II secretory pathway predicted ATPase ExeA